MYLIPLLIVIIFSNLISSEIVLICQINEELENEVDAHQKVYKNKTLKIFIDEKKKWINDFSFSDWEKRKDRFSDINFTSKSNVFLFKLKEFHNQEKKNLESVSEISITKITKILKFKKHYYDFNKKIFFTSEVRGKCK